MKYFVLILATLFLMLFSECDPVSPEIGKQKKSYDFKNLTDFLESSENQADEGYVFYYKKIMGKRETHSELALKAKGVLDVIQKATLYLDSLKDLMPHDYDNMGNAEVPRKLFANTSTEKNINALTKNVYILLLGGL